MSLFFIHKHQHALSKHIATNNKDHTANIEHNKAAIERRFCFDPFFLFFLVHFLFLFLKGRDFFLLALVNLNVLNWFVDVKDDSHVGPFVKFYQNYFNDEYIGYSDHYLFKFKDVAYFLLHFFVFKQHILWKMLQCAITDNDDASQQHQH